MIYGKAGANLDGRFAATAGALTAGRRGEVATAKVIAAHVERYPAVDAMFGLRAPGMARADMDAVVVAGTRVWLIDSKCWAPGTYWGLAGAHMRGWRPAKHTRCATVAASARTLAAWLPAKAKVQKPLVVVWPSARSKQVRLGLFWVKGARVVEGAAFASWMARTVGGAGADPDICAALVRLAR